MSIANLQRVVVRWLMLAYTCTALAGCLGGSIAQQIVSSVLLKGADKVAASAIEAHERKENLKAQQNTEIDPYKLAFATSGFEEIKAQVEPLPDATYQEEVPLAIMQQTKLVQVEIWGFLAGEEKQNVLEKARMQGSLAIPPQTEWKKWQIATGAADNNSIAITFLIPPEIGKMRSGEKAMVEILPANELSFARYSLN